MNWKKWAVAALLLPSFVTVASAANVAAVRPAAKPISASSLAQKPMMALEPATEETNGDVSQLFGAGSLLWIIIGIVVVVTVVAVVADEESSPGS